MYTYDLSNGTKLHFKSKFALECFKSRLPKFEKNFDATIRAAFGVYAESAAIDVDAAAIVLYDRMTIDKKIDDDFGEVTPTIEIVVNV